MRIVPANNAEKGKYTIPLNFSVYRWHNHLDPKITKLPISHQEEQVIFSIHKKLGNKWS